MTKDTDTNKHNAWTPERRAAQAERIRKNKPWEKSTGPKTQKGKNRSKYNALKNARHAAFFRHAYEMIEHNKEFLRLYRKFHFEYGTLHTLLALNAQKNELKTNHDKSIT
ncbi:MAG: hypothetical protein GW903_07775 [Alphaproteobacteria bacterium]|nr:hypothetical protein [Alphaproteobacteria bacterium]NCQ89161.1 hypothetical protein [Alphaproteobacteria bacterium]NCT08265.1 hypothetical protein [Alphaproteobacteria bacterium]